MKTQIVHSQVTPKPAPIPVQQPVTPIQSEEVVTSTQAVETGLSGNLLNYGQDLTAKARQGKIDRIIGREEETDRLIEILFRLQ